VINTGSISEFGWLPTKITGPAGGTPVSPVTSMVRKNTRVTRRRKAENAS
jgi:hypothetical protein